MGAILTVERVLARKLARQVVAALVDQAAAGSGGSREEQLDALLDRGLRLSCAPSVNFHGNGPPVLRRKGTPPLSMIGADGAGREAGLGSNDHGCPRPDPRAGVKAREATRFSGVGLDAEHGSGRRPLQFV